MKAGPTASEGASNGENPALMDKVGLLLSSSLYANMCC